MSWMPEPMKNDDSSAILDLLGNSAAAQVSGVENFILQSYWASIETARGRPLFRSVIVCENVSYCTLSTYLMENKFQHITVLLFQFTVAQITTTLFHNGM